MEIKVTVSDLGSVDFYTLTIKDIFFSCVGFRIPIKQPDVFRGALQHLFSILN